jgi:Carbohydrate esterase, sialic acid-specific acetylesterase
MNSTRQRFKELRGSKVATFILAVAGAALFSTGLIACGGSSDSATATAAAVATPTSAITPTVPSSIDNGKLKIFILAGQSNMVGYGKVDLGADLAKPNRTPHILGGSGSLRAMVNGNPAAYSYLVNANKTITYTIKADATTGATADTKTYASWVIRDDVWVSSWDEGAIGKTTEQRRGPLSVGFGSENVLPAGYIGPEFGFGHMVGNGLADKVLLIKTAWGGKSLAVDFRPPSSGGTTGPYYSEMVAKVRMVLADVKKYCPDYDGKGYEIVGLGWHQGWNDRINSKYVDEYEVNLANLIRDLRKDLSLPAMPVVIANTGMADADKDPIAVKLITAQSNVSDPIKYPEFAGKVSTVDTRPFYYPLTSPETGFIYHWNYNGESYFHIGESMGNAMLKLMKP